MIIDLNINFFKNVKRSRIVSFLFKFPLEKLYIVSTTSPNFRFKIYLIFIPHLNEVEMSGQRLERGRGLAIQHPGNSAKALKWSVPGK